MPDKIHQNKFLHWILISVLIYIPFYRFVQAFLENHTSLSGGNVFWLSHWYEPVLIFLLFFYSITFLLKKDRKVGVDFILALVLLALGVISVFFGANGIGRGIEGFRFSMLPMVVFAVFYLAGFNKDNLIKIFNIYLISALIIGLWAIVEHLLPSSYWSIWGVLSTSASTWFGGHTVDGIRQSVSLIGGPNQLAAYMLPAFFILLLERQTIFKNTKWLIMAIFITTIALTFSRSALIGLAIGLLVFFVLNKNNLIRWSGLALFILAFIASFLIYQFGGTTIKSIFTHGASQSGHITALDTSISEIKARTQTPILLTFGAGLGSAGPAAIKYGDGIVSESWYLQIILEMGLLGLLIWLLYFFFIIKKTVNYYQGLMLGFISIAVASLFLHTLSDNPAGTFVLFALLGINSSLNASENKSKE